MSSAAIIQSNYISWKGYFHIIQSVDHFVFLDSVQYTSRDWRNRNRIKTQSGLRWLTVPVISKRNTLIKDVRIDGTCWQKKHLESLRHAYGKCPHFEKYHDLLSDIYEKRHWTYLSELNHFITALICENLSIETKLHADTEFSAPIGKNTRLLHILKELDVKKYVTGPSAKAYMDIDLYRNTGIDVEFFDYPDYPQYQQLHGDFYQKVTILDLLFHTGEDSAKFIWDNEK